MKGWSSTCSVVAASQTPEPCIACVLCRCILYTDMQLLPYTLYMYSAPLAPDPPPQSPRVAKHRLKGQLQLLARTCNCRCIQTPGYFYETCSVCAIYNELNRNQGSTLCQRTSITTKTPSSLLGQIRPLTRSDPQIFLTEFTSNLPQIHLKSAAFLHFSNKFLRPTTHGIVSGVTSGCAPAKPHKIFLNNSIFGNSKKKFFPII